MFGTIGLTVLREIPVQTVAGLLTGAYRLHGGVVRDAGGRIVAHLLATSPDALKGIIPGVNVLSSLVGSGQAYLIARDVEEVKSMVTSVMAVSSAGAVLAGLGLVTNLAGTAFLSRKLDAVQSQLAHIERLLKDQHLSVLKGAVDNLRDAEHASDKETRKSMLISAKTDFSKSAHFYGSQFADPRSVEEVFALEDSFSLAMLGTAICLSELGMYGAAAADFEGHLDRWQETSRKHVNQHLIGGSALRLLKAEFVHELPARELVGILDFANHSAKGWAWIDDLRRDKGTGPLWGPSDKNVKAGIKLASSLHAKNDVLEAFSAHLRFLDEKKLGIGKFATEAESARSDLGTSVACLVG